MSVNVLDQVVNTRQDVLTKFCRRVLVRIPRADQRRWGEIYVKGLVSLPGRKSLRRIATLTGDDGAEQALQQFVNQSPWDWRPVRGDLALHAGSWLRPQAWVVTDFALPKNGNASVGVDRQYAHSLGRVINCQTGAALFLATKDAAIPVNWRLHLPPSWDTDPERRKRAHVPEHERHRSRWENVISMVNEALSWGIPPAPISLDCSHDLQVDQLVRAFEKRSLRYLIRVGAGVKVAAGARPGEPPLTAGTAAAQVRQGLDGIVLHAGGTGLNTAASSFILRQLPVARSGRHPHTRPRQLLIEVCPGRRSGALWLTNLDGLPVPRQAGLTVLTARSEAEMERIRDRFGLGHFEGRSFRGWHHHATLVSLAQAFITERERTEPGHSF